jgi:hypothetical protein
MLRCEECRREPRESERAADEWRCYSDGLGELRDFCPECAAREFSQMTELTYSTEVDDDR